MRSASRITVFVAILLMWLVEAPPVRAQGQTAIAADVTDDVIAVTSDFRGARITVFGVAPSRGEPGDVLVAIRGPSVPVTVMRKRRTGPLWLNRDPVRFQDAPAFHALASAKPLMEIASTKDIVALGLDPVGHARLSSPTPLDADPSDYRRGLARLQRERGVYQELPRALVMRPGGLYKAQVTLPASAPPGEYTADVYLFRNGRLQATESASISISRQGLEQTIHALANEQPLVYGLFTVALSLFAGWIAALVFRRT